MLLPKVIRAVRLLHHSKCRMNLISTRDQFLDDCSVGNRTTLRTALFSF